MGGILRDLLEVGLQRDADRAIEHSTGVVDPLVDIDEQLVRRRRGSQCAAEEADRNELTSDAVFADEVPDRFRRRSGNRGRGDGE